MMSNKQITMKRLQKEEISLDKDPIPGVFVKREDFLNFHFCIYGLDEPYKGGYYYGLLQLHENYPFAAPKLFFYTRSGRFETDLSICTSFTHYHQESWTSAWNVRSLIIATISFMTSEEPSYGCRNDPASMRKKYAENSLKQNLKIAKFRELFGEDLEKKGIQWKSYEGIESDHPYEEQETSEIEESEKKEMGININDDNIREELEDDLLPKAEMIVERIQEDENNEKQGEVERNRRKKKIITLTIAGIIIAGVSITAYILTQ